MAVFFSILVLISNVWCTQCTNYQLFQSNMVISNFSHKSLKSVPNNLSSWTTVLDLSFNNIQTLLTSDFNYLSKLKSLNASHNEILDLDNNVLELNTFLEYLDLSHNKLRNISYTFPKNLRHLDISFNEFKSMAVCKGLGNLLQLEYLGVGASRMLKSDFEAIAHLQLHNVFIVLHGLSDYENGSLLMLNTKKLHLLLPTHQTDVYNVLYDAVNTSTFLELSNITMDNLHSDLNFSDIAKNSKVSKLTLRDIELQWGILIQAIQYIWHTSVEFLHLYDVLFLGPIERIIFDYSKTSMKEVFIQRARVGVFTFNQNYVYRIFSEMNIERLTINSAHLFYMVCPLKPSNFRNITFSNNALTDDLFPLCDNLHKLETLELRENKLEKLSKMSVMTSNMTSLKHLDISHNLLQYDQETCHWSKSIITLNLASTSLMESVFKCLPINIKTLILKNNEITRIPMDITSFNGLEEINLAYNRLTDLPDCTFFSSLMLLNAENNLILSPSRDTLQSCQRVKQISAGHNPFQCNCEIRSFITQGKNSPGRMIGWPGAYVCEYPEDVKGIQLQNYYLPEIYCNILLLIPVILFPTVFLLVLIFGLCKYFDVPWYLRMIWQWTRTKHRITRKNKDYKALENLIFHAFISYSEHDSTWVKNIFLPSIEKDDGSVRICLHERNFIPGKSIIENIINCIEKSYKSIFVLSPNFVQSEWCHYELYFAQHKLYAENSDNLILILLDPIPQYLIPSRYYKLKALMAQRTYLEWPKEKSKHGLFWANLRAAIHINLSDPEEQSTSSVSSNNA
ncbi:toll-like receptor 6 [Ascaphus truei]|uniref:toll-like receptor 6 n=1 Tax=Ascaphus truei TaxID=8439 RepID=UPI003F59FDD8